MDIYILRLWTQKERGAQGGGGGGGERGRRGRRRGQGERERCSDRASGVATCAGCRPVDDETRESLSVDIYSKTESAERERERLV